MNDFVAYSKKGRLLLDLLGGLALAGIGLWLTEIFGPTPEMTYHSRTYVVAAGWFATVFFGIGSLSLIPRLFTRSEEIRIGRAGIWWSQWSSQTIPWSEISKVTISRSRNTEWVELHIRNPSLFPGRSILGLLSRVIPSEKHGHISFCLEHTDRTFDEAMSAIERFRQ